MGDNALLAQLQQLSSAITFTSAEVDSLTETDIGSLLNASAARASEKTKDKKYQRGVQWAAEIYEKALSHPFGAQIFQEAIRTDEFPTYFGDVLDRMLLARFSEWIPSLPAYVKRGTFRDLTRTDRKTQFRGGSEALGEVGEFGPYPERGVEQVHFGWSGSKFGADFRISWETLLADDLGGLSDLPSLLASAAIQARWRFITGLYMDTNGPHASLINAPNGNLVTSNPALSIGALKTAFSMMGTLVDPVTGNPLFNRPAYLVIPPHLEVTAMEILSATSVDVGQGGATDGIIRPSVNIVTRFGLRVVIDPYMPIVSATNGDTSWLLFAEPVSGPLGPGLAACQFDTLRGMPAPLLLQRRPDFTTLGGGADPRGSLDEFDSITYRVVDAFGGGQLFYQAVVGSNGTGS